MSFGAILSNSEGSVMLDGSEMSFAYYGKKVDGSPSLGLPSDIPVARFSNYSHAQSFAGGAGEEPGGVHTEYFFVPYSRIKVKGNYGLVIYTPTGKVNWHSERPPLMLYEQPTIPGSNKVACVDGLITYIYSRAGDDGGGGGGPGDIRMGDTRLGLPTGGSGGSYIERAWYAIADRTRELETELIPFIGGTDFTYLTPAPVLAVPVIDAQYYDKFANLTVSDLI